MSNQIDISILLKTLSHLRDYAQKIVVVGGWCPYLYAKYLWKVPMRNLARTTDIDLGVYETGLRRFNPTVYEQLVKVPKYVTERIYDDESLPIEFVYKDKAIEVKVEFITSFEVSDDTLHRFLGSEMACHRIEGFELLLESPVIPLCLPYQGKKISFNIISPEIFFFHKGITFPERMKKEKRDKDLQYIYFVLKSCPQREEFLKKVIEFKENDYFAIFQENILNFLQNNSCPGYPILAEMIGLGYQDGYKEIEKNFQPLIKLLSKIN